MSRVGRLVLAIALLSAPWVTFLVLVTVAAVLFVVGSGFALMFEVLLWLASL